MKSEKQLKFNLIITSIFIILGMFLYGLLATFAILPNVVVYSLLGGIFFGGIASGSIIFCRYFKKKKPIVIVILCTLFPISLTIIIIVGIISLIPEYISNVIALIYLKKGIDPELATKSYLKSKRIISLVFGILFIIFFIVYLVNNFVNETNTNDDIYKNTGYIVGSPDYVIFKNYYYEGVNTSYEDDKDYDCVIKNDTLFILANKNGICHSNILFAQFNGMYPDKSNYLKSGNIYSIFLKEELDVLFTEIRIANQGNKHAFMLIIDSRSEQEKIYQIMETRNMDKHITDIFLDKTHADPENIQLFNNRGTLLETMRIANGKYIAFYDSFNDDEKDYKVIVSYDSNEYILLIYNGIVNSDVEFKIK
ncbi:MAG: hypothetical protein WDA65_03690 [Christensenellales bacterium]